MWISVDSVTENSVTLYLSNLDTNWSNGTRTVYWYIGYPENDVTVDNYYQSDISFLEDGEAEGGYVTFYYLDADTNYHVYCEVYRGDTFLADDETQFVTASKEYPSMEKWSWTHSNGSATADETWLAYNAVDERREVIEFSYKVWNDMVDKAKELISIYYDFNWWDSTYETYADTKMDSYNTELTASKFNSLRNNLELIGDYIVGYPIGIERVYPGDKVYGVYFKTFADYMNNCIDKI